MQTNGWPAKRTPGLDQLAAVDERGEAVEDTLEAELIGTGVRARSGPINLNQYTTAVLCHQP